MAAGIAKSSGEGGAPIPLAPLGAGRDAGGGLAGGGPEAGAPRAPGQEALHYNAKLHTVV